MYTNETFQGLLDYWGEKSPDREAIVDAQQRITYQVLKKETQQLAAALQRLSLKKGDKVISLLPNWHEFVVLFFALAKVGAILSPCNVALVKDEVNERMKELQPKVIFVADPAHLVWLKDSGVSCKVVTVRFEEDGYLSYEKLIAQENASLVERADLNPAEDIFAIVYTSGSTGHPKGVELTQRNLFLIAQKIGERLKCTGQDTFLVPLPCCHLFGIVTGILLPFYFGGKIIITNKFCPEMILDLIEHEKVTVLYGVPTMFIRELHEYSRHMTDVRSLRTGLIAGAMCDENLVRQIRTELHCDIMVAYGSTESVGVSMTSFNDDVNTRVQTVGRPYDGVEAKVVDDQGEPVKAGEVGELLCKGIGVMKGYYQRPEETAKVLTSDGWLRTGDLAAIQTRGYIHIAGRKKDIIIRGGYNICPAEIEKVYYSHPSVLEISVIGSPHEELGQQTYAFILLKENSSETEESLRDYVKGKIAKYEIPDRIILLDDMPKLDNGKINKKALEQIYLPKLNTTL